MMERLRPALVLLLLAAAALACNAANLTAPEPAPSVEAVVTTVPSATSPPATMAVVTPEVTPSPPVVHTLFPGEPPPPARFMTDRSSAVLAGEHRSIADDFNNGLFERPFTSQVMDYKSFLDLTRSEIASAGLWVYVTLFLEGRPSAAEPASYGVEIDLDLDGRGDWLIVGAAPPDTTWTTDGVRAHQDLRPAPGTVMSRSSSIRGSARIRTRPGSASRPPTRTRSRSPSSGDSSAGTTSSCGGVGPSPILSRPGRTIRITSRFSRPDPR
ncbi:MAG: hypothetical protein HW404_1293 [Anaerolineales bacterium]|nr:hypothetical protein [Anaerolineales bacterium]